MSIFQPPGYLSARFDGRFLPPLAGADTKRVPFKSALTYLLVSQFLCILALAGQVNWIVLAVFSACALWRALAERRGWALPSLMIRLIIFAPSVSAVAMIYGLQPTAGSLLALLIVLLALKFLELRTTRDFTVVAVLGYFMVLSALFYNQDFGLCLYLAVAVLLNTTSLICVHLGAGAGTVKPAMRLALGLLLQATPLVVLLFVIFPRVQVSFLRKLSNSNGSSTGMSDHLQPGSIESVALSLETAFRVTFGTSNPPIVEDLYWRGIVLSKAEDAMSWRAEGGGAQIIRIDPPSASPPPAGSIEQIITLMPQGDPWLFALDRPVQVSNSSVRPHYYAGTQQIKSDRPIFSKSNYVVYSKPGASGAGTLTEIARKYYTRIPPNVSQRVLDLVKSWQGNRPDPSAVILGAQSFFHSGEFLYTLQPGPLPPKGALDAFLFQSKRGFCEHYAAAFAR